jgi:hypothetical protein
VITISAAQRDLLYDRILLHLSGIESVWLAAHHRDYDAAERLGRQYSDELLIVLEDLGWGETRGDEPVVLTSSTDLIRRFIESLREVVEAEDADERKGREAMRKAQAENREVRSMCEVVLGQLDQAPRVGAAENA